MQARERRGVWLKADRIQMIRSAEHLLSGFLATIFGLDGGSWAKCDDFGMDIF